MNDDARATLTPADGGLTRLELEGAFTHPHWLPFLCGGLSAAGIAVVSGQTRRESPMQWQASLLLDDARARTPLDLLDPIRLAATRPAARDPRPPHLTSFELVRLADQQVEVTIKAQDELGFLSRFLSRVSLLTLLPSQLDIQTLGSTISDRIVFGGIGSAPPSDEVVTALQELLTGLLAPASIGSAS